MLVVTPLLDQYYQWRLRSSSYRKNVYAAALRGELHSSKLGTVLLRNLNVLMARYPEWHDEVKAVAPNDDYARIFWQGDLGYLWYQGNYSAPNPYFDFVLEHANGYVSHLDVGCGWGELCAKVAGRAEMQCVLGVDIAPRAIEVANRRHVRPNLAFRCCDVRQVNDSFDLVTCFGATDYMTPALFPELLKKMIALTRSELILSHSLRGQPYEQVLELRESRLVRRYDEGHVHPVAHLLKQLQTSLQFKFETQKFGADSLLVRVKRDGVRP